MATLEVTIPELVAHVKGLRVSAMIAVADVGATNTRFSLLTNFAARDRVLYVKRQAQSVPALKQLFTLIQAALGHEICSRIVAASIAVPGPVSEKNTAVIANFAADTTEGRTVRVSDLPQELFPASKTLLLNDLEAAAYGLLGLEAAGKLSSVFHVLWEKQRNPSLPPALLTKLPRGNVIIIAPGTGLGSALLHFQPSSGYRVIPLEFGHTNVPLLDHQEFLRFVTKSVGYPVEYDDVCTGRGLERAYQFYSGGRTLAAADISKRAQEGSDEAAVTAMHAYNDCLMAYASQLTMGLLSSLVVIVGDNTINNAHYYERVTNVNRMHRRLLAHSSERMGFMSRTAMVVQSVRVNLNIVGCMYAADQAVSRNTSSIAKAAQAKL